MWPKTGLVILHLSCGSNVVVEGLWFHFSSHHLALRLLPLSVIFSLCFQNCHRRKFWGWCIMSFLLGFWAYRWQRITGWLLSLLLLRAGRDKLGGRHTTSVPPVGKFKKWLKSSLLWPWVCSTLTQEGSIIKSGTSWPIWNNEASGPLLKRCSSLWCCGLTPFKGAHMNHSSLQLPLSLCRFLSLLWLDLSSVGDLTNGHFPRS